MKYWNKSKDVRMACWTRVVVSAGDATPKRWCQQHPSNGRFYKYFGANTWWFENAEDAVTFKLKWGGRDL